ncbi:metal ABC transporter substrate-binding lipoprotein [Streptococcus pacificus]|uniref:metal ABC transporter substrate-binding lipoprotein n=1 Tax=Streptococcus pacificus TaxID=2740577 RepID=UPI003CCCCB67
MINKKFLGFLGALVAIVLLVGCSTSKKADEAADTNEKISVVVTNSILADMTKNIAGDLVDLHSIVPIGQDPHEYEPLSEDVRKTTDADLIFYNGINLETGGNAWFTKLIENAGKKENEDYFAASDGVEIIYLEGENEEGKEDPHAWLSLENGIIYAKNIGKHLMEKDPANKDAYQKNLDAYVEKLEALDKKAKSAFDAIPEDRKLIVTSEGAFKYFSKAYNVPSAYIWEINTEEEGTPEQITTLVDKLRSTDLKALFVESSVDRRPMETVSKDTNIPIYAEIFTDSVAEEGEDGDSYYAMMEWNLNKIAEGLGQ